MVEIDANKNVLYNPLGEESFDKGKFVDGYKRLQTLEEIASTLSKGGQLSAKLTGLAGQILHGDKTLYFNAANTANLEEACNSAVKEGRSGLENYVRKNLKQIKDKVPEEAYPEMVSRVKLNKSKGDENHNDIVVAQEELNKFRDAVQDEGKIIKYLADKMKKAPKWAKAEFERMQGNEKYIQSLIKSYGSYYSTMFKYLTSTEDFNARETFDKGFKGASKNEGDYLKLIGSAAFPVFNEEVEKEAA